MNWFQVWIPRILIFLFLVGTALLVSPFSLESFFLPKEVFAQQSLLILILLWVLWRPWSVFGSKDSAFVCLERTPVDLPILGILLCAGVSILVSVYPYRNGFKSMRVLCSFVLALYLIVEWIRAQRSIRWLMDIGLSTACIIAIYAIAQDRGIDWAEFSGGVPDWRGRLSSTLGSPDFVGNYLAVWIPYPVLRCGREPMRWVLVYLFALCLLVAGLTVTFSMGAWWGLFATLLVSGCVSASGRVREWFFRIRWQRVLLVVLAIAFPMGYYLLPNPISGHPEGLLQEAKASPRWTSGMGARGFIWKTTALMVRDHPWFGVGVGNYGAAHPAYQGRLYQIRGTPHDRDSVGIVPQTHNEYYQWLAEAGAFGFMALVWFLVSFCRAVGRIRFQRDSNQEDTIWTSSLYGLCVFAFHSLVTFPVQMPANRIVGLLFLAVALSPTVLEHSSSESAGCVRKRGLGSLMAGALVILTLGCIVDVSKPLISDHFAWRALREVNPLRRIYLERALDWNADSWVNWLYYGEALKAEGRPHAAAMAWEHSARLEDRLLAHELLYRAYMELGRGNDLVRQVEAIVRLNPCYPPNQIRLGDEYSRMGRSQDAQTAYREAVRLDSSLESRLHGKIQETYQKLESPQD